jgi:hypothetical protein
MSYDRPYGALVGPPFEAWCAICIAPDKSERPAVGTSCGVLTSWARLTVAAARLLARCLAAWARAVRLLARAVPHFEMRWFHGPISDRAGGAHLGALPSLVGPMANDRSPP